MREEKEALKGEVHFLGSQESFDMRCRMLSPFQLKLYYVLFYQIWHWLTWTEYRGSYIPAFLWTENIFRKYRKCEADWFSYNSWLLSNQKIYILLSAYFFCTKHQCYFQGESVASGRRLWVEEFPPRSSGSVTQNQGTLSPGECCQPTFSPSQFTLSILPQLQRRTPPALQTAEPCQILCPHQSPFKCQQNDPTDKDSELMNQHPLKSFSVNWHRELDWPP